MPGFGDELYHVFFSRLFNKSEILENILASENKINRDNCVWPCYNDIKSNIAWKYRKHTDKVVKEPEHD